MSNLVSIKPEKDLEFRAPFTSNVKQTVSITNTHPTTAIAFKVKTTAPKQYSVRPNAGKLSPGQSMDISVVFQALKDGEEATSPTSPSGLSDTLSRRKDKFLFQVIKIPTEVTELDGEALNNKIADLWANAELLRKTVPNVDEPVIFEQKLRSVFVMNGQDGSQSSQSLMDFSSSTSGRISQSHTSGSIRSFGGSGRNDFPDSTIHSPSYGDAPSRPVSVALSDMTTVTALPHPEQSSSPSPTRTAIASSATPVAGGGSNTPTNTTIRELHDAKEKIKSLQAACDAYKLEIERINALRQRRHEASPGPATLSNTGPTPHSSTLSSKNSENTYPFHLVIVIAILSFFFGVFFF